MPQLNQKGDLYQDSSLQFQNRYRNNGAPMKAVIVSTGKLAGAMMVLATRSSPNSSRAPKSPGAGKADHAGGDKSGQHHS